MSDLGRWQFGEEMTSLRNKTLEEVCQDSQFLHTTGCYSFTLQIVTMLDMYFCLKNLVYM